MKRIIYLQEGGITSTQDRLVHTFFIASAVAQLSPEIEKTTEFGCHFVNFRLWDNFFLFNVEKLEGEFSLYRKSKKFIQLTLVG